MYRLTLVALLAAALVQAQDIPTQLAPLVTAQPSDIPAVVSGLLASGVTLPTQIPTNPAALSSIADSIANSAAAISSAYAQGALPSDYPAQISSFIESFAPTARISDLPAIAASGEASAVSALNSLAPHGYISSYYQAVSSEYAALASDIPGSESLIAALPTALVGAYTSGGFGGPATGAGPIVTGGAGGSVVAGNSTVPRATQAPSLTTSKVGASPSGSASGSQSAASSVATGAAPGFGVAGWTGALAGVAAGAVAFL